MKADLKLLEDQKWAKEVIAKQIYKFTSKIEQLASGNIDNMRKMFEDKQTEKDKQAKIQLEQQELLAKLQVEIDEKNQEIEKRKQCE